MATRLDSKVFAKVGACRQTAKKNMQQFTIKDVENLVGIKAHTLRIWELRYPFFSPKRKLSKHRYYENEDLKVLLQVAFLYHLGWRISRIATLSPEERMEAVGAIEPNRNTYPHFVIQLVARSIEFDEAGFSEIIEKLTEEIGFERTVLEVCFPFLQRVGMLWVTNRIVPAQEHFSSYIIQNKIISEIEKTPLPKHPPEVLLFTPKGEFHEMPLLFLHYMLRKWGWSVLFLGKNITFDVLDSFKDHKEIKYLFLHLLTNLTQLDPDVYLEQLVRHFPDKKIIASGRAIHGVQRPFVNVTKLLSDEAIRKFIETGRAASS